MGRGDTYPACAVGEESSSETSAIESTGGVLRNSPEAIDLLSV